jgi:hypothetical protein
MVSYHETAVSDIHFTHAPKLKQVQSRASKFMRQSTGEYRRTVEATLHNVTTNSLAFLDINPVAVGHTQVIPKCMSPFPVRLRLMCVS